MHLLTLADYSEGDIRRRINNALDHKYNPTPASTPTGESVALIFMKPSTRTRVSLEAAAAYLGLHPIYLEARTTQLSRGEPIKDFARVLSRYVSGITARVYSHKDLEELAERSDVPVINALSDRFHPLQALADLMTIYEHFNRISGLKIAFVGDGSSNVANSLAIGACKLGAEMRIATPKELQPDKLVLEVCGDRLHITEDPVEAVKGAHVIYTDVRVSMGQEAEAEKKKQLLRPYQVNAELVKHAHEDYIFMHCLPRHVGEEVTDDVFEDEEHSVVFEQAENRMRTAIAVFEDLILGI